MKLKHEDGVYKAEHVNCNWQCRYPTCIAFIYLLFIFFIVNFVRAVSHSSNADSIFRRRMAHGNCPSFIWEKLWSAGPAGRGVLQKPSKGDFAFSVLLHHPWHLRLCLWVLRVASLFVFQAHFLRPGCFRAAVERGAFSPDRHDLCFKGEWLQDQCLWDSKSSAGVACACSQHPLAQPGFYSPKILRSRRCEPSAEFSMTKNTKTYHAHTLPLPHTKLAVFKQRWGIKTFMNIYSNVLYKICKS